MFSLQRTPSQQDATTTTTTDDTSFIVDPVPGGATGTNDEIEDCTTTLVPIIMQIKPVLDLIICKPQIVIKNKAICKTNCDC